MFWIFIDFLMIISCVVGCIMNFNKNWSNFGIFLVLTLHSASHLSTHFRRKFINKWDG